MKRVNGHRGRPTKLEAMLASTDVGALVTGAKAQLAKAVAQVRLASMKTGPLYGVVVKHVGTCLDIGLKTQDISQVIVNAWGNGGAERASKGIAARYIVLARYQRRSYRKNEHDYGKNVTVAGVKYPDPLAALDSGDTTFTAVYQAWTGACQVKPKVSVPPASAFDSAAVVMAGLKVPVAAVDEDGEPVVKRVKVTEDLDAFVGALASLLASPVAAQVTTAKQRREILNALSTTPKVSEHAHTGVLHVLPQAA